ncbi:MAG: hypothetical protein BGO11_00095 [Solirubrobacterales bacterium 70-9]|nr:MAG: hypothetical protein BGO11_00095 [Solirubrobacterales bacterium 70-9]
MKRIKRGWALTKKSWALLNSHRELVRFPLYGGIATIILGLITLGPGAFALDKHSYGIGIPLVVIGIYVLSVVGIYFSVGLAACADLIFRGQNATVGDGMAVANSRLSAIFGWAALSTAIAVIIGALENQGGALGDIAGRLVGAAWSLVTFLSVPVIAIEGTGPFATLKRSASLFKERWGQQITGNIAIGGAVFLIGFLPAVILIVVGVVIWPSTGIAGGALIVIGALILCVALLVSKALSGIFGVALYRYALEGEVVGGFTQEDLESAVKQKRGAKHTGATPGTV